MGEQRENNNNNQRVHCHIPYQTLLQYLYPSTCVHRIYDLPHYGLSSQKNAHRKFEFKISQRFQISTTKSSATNAGHKNGHFIIFRSVSLTFDECEMEYFCRLFCQLQVSSKFCSIKLFIICNRIFFSLCLSLYLFG